MNEVRRVIYTCDVGSTRNQKNREGPAFAWARLDPNEERKSIQGHRDIKQLVMKLELDIDEGYSVALGFEAPLFIPVPDNACDLSTARCGEGTPSWASRIGLAVSALGIHQSAQLGGLDHVVCQSRFSAEQSQVNTNRIARICDL